jgi:uncharacterized repeat protein (TIGR03806 family)
MNITNIFKGSEKLTTLALAVSLLSAYGSDTAPSELTPVVDTNPAICTSDSTDVNWEALLTENCENLSDYNLFTEKTDPTSSPNGTGIPYDLSTALFTDYATKYRFIYVPDGETATYSEHEVMAFPVGSVLVKTFALPDDTAVRDGAETIIETRLLINRADGWTALPYYWENTADAEYVVAGKTVGVSIIHNAAELTFDYLVPQKNQCTKCHTVNPIRQGTDDKRGKIFIPIGPKARFLSNSYTYPDGITENQLTHWENAGILTGAPDDKSTIDTAADFHDDVVLDNLSIDEITLAARSYLDINCAHCHRSELTIPEPFYSGPAGDSGLQVEFNRDLDANPSSFGICKRAIASGGGDEYPRDIVPGYPENSYLPFRMNSLEGQHKMPELGRSTNHTEGVALIKAWIATMTPNPCGL